MTARRFRIVPAALLAAILLLAPATAIAGEAAETEGTVYVGGHTSIVGDDGTLVKVREYDLGREIYQSSLWVDFFGRSGDNRFETSIGYKDERTMGFWMRADMGPYLSARTHYRSFHHWLDHDLLEGITFQEKLGELDDGSDKRGGKIVTTEDLDPDGVYGIRYSEMRQRIDFDIPGNEKVDPKLRVEYREERRFGHDQALSLDHCANCHVRSRAKLVNDRTQDFRGTLSAAFSRVALWYDFFGRRYVNNAEAPLNKYMKARHPTLFDPNTGSPDYAAGEFASRVVYENETLELNDAPDMEKLTHALRLRVDLPASNTVIASFSYGTIENQRTALQMTTLASAASWHKPVNEKLRFTAGAAYRDIDNDDYFVDLPSWRAGGAGGDIDFDYTRMSAYNRTELTAKASAIYKVRKGCSAGLHYRFRSLDRENVVVDPADPDGTKAIQNRIKAAVNSRAIKNLKVRATVEYEMTDLPFANVGGLCEPALGDTISPIGDAPSIYYFQRPRTGNGSNRPSGAIRGNLNVSYRFSPRFSFTGYFGLADEENTELVSYEWEKTALTPGAMAYFIPTDKVTLSGGVSYSKIESNAKICVPVMDG